MFKYSIGNKKLGKDTLIFNMGPATGCPSKARGFCQVPDGKCYALKAERCYPGCLPYRKAQARYWIGSHEKEIAADIIAAAKKHKSIKFVRVNESGDFYNQTDVSKLYDVARLVSGLIFYVYTARKDLKFPHGPENLIVNGSGFMLDNCFRYQAPEYDFICPGDCRRCDLCKERGKMIIRVEAH